MFLFLENSLDLNNEEFFITSLRPSCTHQNNPQTPQVTGLVVAVVFEDLWRGVLQSEAGSLQELIVWWFEASEAKVDDFYLRVLTLVGEEQVLRSNSRHEQSFLSALQNWSTQELKVDIETRPFRSM